MKKILIPFLIAAVAAVGCKKDDTLRYNNITMGNIDLGDQTIVSDQGNTFDIKENMANADLNSFKYGRVMLICDVLQETSENRYDIRLSWIESVLTKPVVKASTITEADKDLMVEDAVNIREIWYGGGYINMLIEVVQRRGDNTDHIINLIHDDTAEEEGYVFTLRHNANGETPKAEDNANFKSAIGYVSFPIADLIEDDEAKLTIKWKSHKFLIGGDFSLLETEDIAKTYEWKRIGFEHQPSKVPTQSSARIK